MGRSPCCEKKGLNKGPWTPHEDQILVNYIRLHGHSNWRALPKLAGLSRCGKSCRLRWINYLRPDIKRGNFTLEEEETILKLHELLGNRWSAIAAKLPGRTDNEIKNIWHTHLKKRVLDPNQLKSGTSLDPTPKPAKKRVRKSRVGKSGEMSKKLKVEENVECVRLQPKNDNYNGDDKDMDECSERRPTRFVKNEQSSPQPCVSTSEMSTVTSTSSTNDNTSKEIAEGYFGDFPEFSDDFWLEVLSIDQDTAMSIDQEHLPSISEYNPHTLPGHMISEQVFKPESGDGMDFFWHSLLTRTSSSDLPEFSEIAL